MTVCIQKGDVSSSFLASLAAMALAALAGVSLLTRPSCRSATAKFCAPRNFQYVAPVLLVEKVGLELCTIDWADRT